MAGKLSVPKDSLLGDVIPYLLLDVTKRLGAGDEQGIEDAIAVLTSYKITIEQFKENMLELCDRSKGAVRFNALEPRVKAAFTRVYHKEHPDIVVKKKKATAVAGILAKLLTKHR